MRRAAGVLAAAALLAGPAHARAQGLAPAWETSFRFQHESFDAGEGAWSSWITATGAVERVDTGGTFRLEFVESRRFTRWDAALAAETWRSLWESAYGNLRVEAAPDADGRAEVDLHAALYQGVGSGWEAGAGWRQQRFDDGGGTADALTVSAARYFDGGYFRAGVEVSGLDGFDGAAFTGVARYYFSPPHDLVEVGASWGESVEVVGTGPVVAFEEGTHLHARAQLFPWPHAGFGLGARVRTFHGIPDRYGFTASVHARW